MDIHSHGRTIGGGARDQQCPVADGGMRLRWAGAALCLASLSLACGPEDGTEGQQGTGQGNAPGMGTGAVPGMGTGGTPPGNTGGAPPVGTGGITGTGGTTTEGKMEVTCSINVLRSEPSTNIATVGIVEFGTDLQGVDSAVIQFGPTENYIYEAPVDLTEPNYRTLLLGMTQNATYHYRIAVFAGNNVCFSADQTIQTGNLPNGGPSNLTSQPGPSTAPVAEGFIVTTTGLQGSWVYIVNHEGQLVWAYSVGQGGFGFTGITRARMSWDGKHMWARDLNVSGTNGQGTIYKIAMDGSTSETFQLSTSHHDFTVTKDNGVAYLAKEGSTGTNSPCDAIRKIDANGEQNTLVYDLWNALSSFDYQSQLSELCHANAIQYSESEDSFTVSELYRDVIIKVSASGQLDWVIGGSHGDFTGDVSWNAQHGHHLIGPDRLLFFNNNSNGQASRAIELQLNLSAMTAQQTFNYASGNTHTGQLGDVQRLPNGNTLVTFSIVGKIDEVDPNGQLIRSFSTNAFGYTNFRPTLYGPPVR